RIERFEGRSKGAVELQQRPGMMRGRTIEAQLPGAQHDDAEQQCADDQDCENRISAGWMLFGSSHEPIRSQLAFRAICIGWKLRIVNYISATRVLPTPA